MTLTKTVNGPRTASLQISMPRWGRMTRQESPKVQGVKEGRMREKSRQPPRLTPTQSDVRISHSMVAVSSDGTHNSAHDHGSDFENVQTSPESQNMPATSRPEHPRVGGVCRSVDTIKWARSHLRLLNEQIDALRQQHHDDQGKKINAVFIEFDSYASAQAAYQTSIQYPPFQLSERVIGVRPGEVVWGSLGIKWWQRLVRQFLVLIVISACVILWWFPATIADAMTTPSTVKHYMPSVARLPPIATNIISGLGRSLLMVVLLEIIPIFMRACAKFSGAPTLSAIEMHVQSRYFVFQILQVFLGPILGLNIYHAAGYESILLYLLPNASSYYMTFILVRCLSTGAWELTQLWRLFRHKSRATRAGTQQTVYRRLHDLNVVHWGNVYPAIANIGVIAISYCCIAPLILAFAVTGLGFLHFVYKYNLIYVYDSNTLDTRGLFYPRALRHIIIGPYLAQFYFICRFVMVRAWGQLALTGLLSLFTVFLHNSVRSTMNPFDGLFRTPGHDVERASTQQNEPERDEHPHHEVGRRHRFSATEHLSNVVPKYVPRDATPVIANEACLSRRDQRQKTHRICGKWPRSLTLENPQSLHHIVSHVSADIKFPTQYEHQRYLPPEVWLPEPKLWIPRDETLMMSQGLAVTEAMLPTSDNGIWFEENGRVELDLELAPFKDDLLLYHHLRLIL
ncbi:hypothetical protein QQS21_004910 [Conoideocrella luteorostrata]|uniref:CSC1/OSCA1-like 7TM region domain-containing protein n=1 Tax=Conoideocrella luteorostrata TaxID=1105319 RepID=A0AAJ0CQE4_9HYPO|nr:hypothetical protein QQS21_004910 [Conoideocrella luteorostrata]